MWCWVYDSNNIIRGIQDEDYILVSCKRNFIEKMIIKGHYSHTMPKNSDMCFAVFYKRKHEGALSLGYGIRPEIKTTWGNINKTEMREFDRMWLTDIPPKNSESKVIGMLCKIIRKLRPEIKFLISYSDGSVGNLGIIYQATNFIKMGSVQVDFYILPDGRRVHPVTMWHRHKTRAWKTLQEIYPGIKHIKGTDQQYRYLLPLYKNDKRRMNKEK